VQPEQRVCALIWREPILELLIIQQPLSAIAKSLSDGMVVPRHTVDRTGQPFLDSPVADVALLVLQFGDFRFHVCAECVELLVFNERGLCPYDGLVALQ
jgi:hypothetical protein